MRDDLDFEARELCPDGDCIGVIGANGKCKVCGKAGTGKPPFRTPAAGNDNAESADDAAGDEDSRDASGEEDEEGDEGGGDDEKGEDGEDGEDEADAGVDRDGDGSLAVSSGDKSAWDERALCPDDTCIGVIGSDGRCKVCGKRA